MSQKTILVTGAAGFIGSNFVRHLLITTESRVVALDKLTYAGHRESLADVEKDPRFAFVEGDIADGKAMRELLRTHKPAAIVNFAAETHVDRSIDGPRAFVMTNLVGTFELLDALHQHARDKGPPCRLLHVSTDEVYGTLGPAGLFWEESPYAPNSPYAASKAGADHLVRAYHETYGLDALITNCSNNYGPYQFPEKLIPLMILNAIEGKPLPIYGDGGNVRDWLYVDDHCEGIRLVLERGRSGEKYNIGSGNERNNREVVERICAILERERPAAAHGLTSYARLQTFVKDRPGHDRRYAIDAKKIRAELGWRARHDFESGLERTVRWYLGNREWCEAVQAGRSARERQGLRTKVR